MDNFTIAEYITLPSRGLVYDKKVVPEVHMSSMTTRHEMQRLAPSKSQFKPLCDVIDDCLIDKIGISSYDMCTGDYQFLLFKLRMVTYGSDIKLKDRCPFCGDVSDLKLNMDDLKIVDDIESFNKYREFELPVTKKKIKLRYQTPHMLDYVIEKAEEFKERVGDTAVDQSMVFSIREIIDTVDGHKPDPLNVDEWIRNLPMMDTNTIFAYAEKMDSSIGIDTDLSVVCDRCGKEHKTSFKVGPDFFRPEIDV